MAMTGGTPMIRVGAIWYGFAGTFTVIRRASHHTDWTALVAHPLAGSVLVQVEQED